jgi:hypothetical protein
MENFAGFVFRITSRPALQETDRLLDLRVAFLDDRLCRLDETGFIDNLAKIHPVKLFSEVFVQF